MELAVRQVNRQIEACVGRAVVVKLSGLFRAYLVLVLATMTAVDFNTRFGQGIRVSSDWAPLCSYVQR